MTPLPSCPWTTCPGSRTSLGQAALPLRLHSETSTTVRRRSEGLAKSDAPCEKRCEVPNPKAAGDFCVDNVCLPSRDCNMGTVFRWADEGGDITGVLSSSTHMLAQEFVQAYRCPRTLVCVHCGPRAVRPVKTFDVPGCTHRGEHSVRHHTWSGDRVAHLCEMYTCGLCPDVPKPYMGALGDVDLGCAPNEEREAACQFGLPDILSNCAETRGMRSPQQRDSSRNSVVVEVG